MASLATVSAPAGSRLVVLGSCGAWPEPGRACNGFVLEHDGFRVVIDLGYATLPRLLTHLDSVNADGIDAIVVTHRHPDHCVDLHGLFRSRSLARLRRPAIPLYAPRGVIDIVMDLQENHERDEVLDVFDWHALPADPYQLGPLRIESWLLPHYVPNAGVRLTLGDLVVAYTGDSGPEDVLATLAAGADLFIAEASEPQKTLGPDQRNYLAAAEAAIVASKAGVHRLLLTHFWPGTARPAYALAAREHFDGEIFLADEGLVLDLL